jgi:hypothetical protein
MSWRKPMLLGILSSFPCLVVFSLACAQEAAPPRKPEASSVADDDFRPLPPQAKPKDRGPSGPARRGAPWIDHWGPAQE